jgi:anti-sigma factor RsiW
VRSTDRHTVKPWFGGRLDFAPDVRDFKDESFALEGGRLDYVAGRPVAALVYRHDKHYLNLFIWPAGDRSERGPVATRQQGFSLVHWAHAGMNYWVISDVSEDTLRRFSSLTVAADAASTRPAS